MNVFIITSARDFVTTQCIKVRILYRALLKSKIKSGIFEQIQELKNKYVIRGVQGRHNWGILKTQMSKARMEGHEQKSKKR